VKIVDVHPLPVPNFSATNVCFYDTSKFTDLSLVTSGNIVNWIWNFNDGNILSSTQNPQHYYTTAGTYAVGLTTTTNFNCVDSMKKNVEVYDLPVADFVPDINYGCEPLAVIFTDHSTSTDGNLVSWKWNLGNDSTPTTQYTNTIYPVHGNYTVSLITTTSFGCKDTIIYPDLISVYPNPTAGFTFDPEHPTILNPVIYFTDKSQIADFWTYTFGDNSDASRSQNPVHEYLAPGTYTVEQIVMTHFGCFDTLWATLEVASAYTFYLPDAFSPNNDGRNDFFTGKGIGIQNFDMVIFNRWGNKVFETDNISSGWNGGNSQEGTYVYVISVKDIFNDVHHLHGTVKLVR
jgi:gliding motility-associated-like protein